MTLESGKPIRIGNFHPPQIKVAKTGKYKELTDETYNTQSVQTVSVHKQYFEGSGNLTKEFDEDMHGLSIYNDHTEIMRFVIDGVSIPVFPKRSWNDVFKDSFRTVSIIASGPWYIMPLQRIGAAASIVEPEPPDTTAPDNVTGLEIVDVTQNSARSNWFASASSDTVGYQVWLSGSMITTVTGTTVPITGLLPQTQYTLTIKPFDAAGNVASGTSINVTTQAQPSDTTPPNNVTGLEKSNVTQTGATLTWIASDSSDLKDYRIYNGSTLVATVTTLTYGVTGLTASNNYTFTVKARDTANNEASGTSVSVTTSAPADTTAPVLTITAAATFADTKQVEMSTNETADIYYTLDGSTPTTADTKYTTALTLNATTTVKAMARDAAGNESAVQTVIYTKDAEAPPDTEAPDPVSDLTAGTPTATTVQITWTPSTSEDVIAQELSYTPGDVNYRLISMVSPTTSSYSVIDLEPETDYNIKVVAIDAAENRSVGKIVRATTAAIATFPAITDAFSTDKASLTTTDTGETWTSASGVVHGVVGGQWAVTTQSGTPSNDYKSSSHVTVNSADFAVEVDMAVYAIGMAVHLRYQSATNLLMMYIPSGKYTFAKWESGAYSVLVSGNRTAKSGDKLRIEHFASGKIVLFVNGSYELEITSSLLLSTTHNVGLAAISTTARFDNFVAKPLVPITVITGIDPLTADITDSFNRMDNEQMGQADTHQLWKRDGVSISRAGIQSNQAYFPGAITGQYKTPEYIHISEVDFAVECNFAVLGNFQTIHLRFVDAGNCVFVSKWNTGNQYQLNKWVGGTFAAIKAGTALAAANDLVRIEHRSDGSIKVYINDVLDIDFVNTDLMGESYKVGIAADTNVARFDNFKIEPLA